MAGQKTNGKGERSLPPFARRRRNAGELPEERNLPFIRRSCPSEKRKPQEQPQTRDYYSLLSIQYSVFIKPPSAAFLPRTPFRGLHLMKTPKVLQRKAKFRSSLFKPAAALDPGIVSRLLLLKVLQRRASFRPPFSKGGRVQRQRLWSRSAERETPKPAAPRRCPVTPSRNRL